MPLMNCNFYNAPNPSPYQWDSVTLNSLLEHLNAYAKENKCKQVVITGDFDFSQTTLPKMSSKNPYEGEVIIKLVEHNFEQFCKRPTVCISQ